MWKEASPEHSATPREIAWHLFSYRLGRAGSCDLAHRVGFGGSLSASVLSTCAAANCLWLGEATAWKIVKMGLSSVKASVVATERSS